ncbi:hypothetical protein ACFFRR_003876 [Megaselia abdita]
MLGYLYVLGGPSSRGVGWTAFSGRMQASLSGTGFFGRNWLASWAGTGWLLGQELAGRINANAASGLGNFLYLVLFVHGWADHAFHSRSMGFYIHRSPMEMQSPQDSHHQNLSQLHCIGNNAIGSCARYSFLRIACLFLL